MLSVFCVPIQKYFVYAKYEDSPNVSKLFFEGRTKGDLILSCLVFEAHLLSGFVY